MLPSVGYFGPVTATVDWCEANYAVTPLVAELWNTISSFAMLGAGIFGILAHRGVVDRKVLAAFGIVAIVGAGSIGFHATLRFELQMLDELPMFYAASLMTYLLVERRPVRRFGSWFPASLVLLSVVFTALLTRARGPLQVLIFQGCFSVLEFLSLFLIFRIAREGDATTKRLFRRGIACYAAAIAAWLADVHACSFLSALPLGLPNPQLHAVWHVLVSAGWYLLVLVMAFDRARQYGDSLVFAWVAKIPVLRRAASTPTDAVSRVAPIAGFAGRT